MDRINHLVVESTKSITDLCILATEFPTDKSPFNFHPQQVRYRHSYTAIYDLLFSTRRYEPIVFGELGILDLMSMRTWRQYFPRAMLYGFDAFEERVQAGRQAALPNTYYGLADVTSRASMFEAFNDTRQAFDVLIDDSTHLFDDQVRFVDVAVEFLKPGGTLVVEDVFEGWEEARYCEALQPYYRYFSSGTFIQAAHAHAYAKGLPEPYHDNNKLLVLTRNQVPIVRTNPQAAENRRLLDDALADPIFVERARK